MVERHGHAHRIHEHACRLGRIIVVLREGVSGLDAAKVWNFDSLKRSHFVIVSGFRVVIYLQYALEGKEVNMPPTGVSRVSPSITCL